MKKILPYIFLIFCFSCKKQPKLQNKITSNYLTKTAGKSKMKNIFSNKVDDEEKLPENTNRDIDIVYSMTLNLSKLKFKKEFETCRNNININQPKGDEFSKKDIINYRYLNKVILFLSIASKVEIKDNKVWIFRGCKSDLECFYEGLRASNRILDNIIRYTEKDDDNSDSKIKDFGLYIGLWTKSKSTMFLNEVKGIMDKLKFRDTQEDNESNELNNTIEKLKKLGVYPKSEEDGDEDDNDDDDDDDDDNDSEDE